MSNLQIHSFFPFLGFLGFHTVKPKCGRLHHANKTPVEYYHACSRVRGCESATTEFLFWTCAIP